MLCLSLCIYGYLFNNRQKSLDGGFAEEMHIVRQNTQKGERTTIVPIEEAEDTDIDFQKLREINPDVVAWIDIPGTTVSYPVLQAGEEDSEDYYLKRNIYKEPDRHGSLYVQRTNNDPEGFLTAVYGHNMRDGTMFHDLHRFRKESFRGKNNTVFLYTEIRKYRYRILDAWLSDGSSLEQLYGDLSDYSVRMNYLSEIGKHGGDANELTEDSRLLTLITCTDDGKGRLHIDAVLMEVEE